jgi:hypothetical protein
MRLWHGIADRHFLARHSGAGDRQARPRGCEGAAVAAIPRGGGPRRDACRQRQLDAYLADWARSPPRPCGDDLQAEASAEAARLEAKFTDEDLERLIRAKGVDAKPASESA